MILSNECWMKDTCKKQNKTCIECNEFCMKLFKINELYKKSGLTNEQKKPINLYLDKTKSDKNAFTKLSEIKSNISNFIKDGNNLFIWSRNCGNGKSSWCVKLLQSYIDEIWAVSDITCRVLFIHVPRFLISLKNNLSNSDEYAEFIKENVLQADVVVWDELATKTATPFEIENLLTFINTRLSVGKSNFYTSNVEPKEISEVMGDRLYSRVINTATVIELKAPDMRKWATTNGTRTDN